MPQIVSDSDFNAKVLESGLPVIVDFWASWCGPCQMMNPIMHELAEEVRGKATICKMNIDENPQIPAQFGIKSIPTLLLFKNGKMVASKVGVQTKEKLLEWLEQF